MNKNTFKTFNPPSNYGVDENDSRFFKSFRLDEEDEYRNFFSKCGFVIVRDVISAQDCDATVDKIWDLLEDVSTANRKDPSTWTERWPTNKTGILGTPIASDTMAWKNRQSKNIHKVFSKLYGTTKLLVSVDRYNVMRPTKNVKFCNGEVKDCDEWKGLESWFHWDLNPWFWTGLLKDEIEKKPFENHYLLFSHNLGKLITEGNDTPKKYPNSLKLQGLVALGDTSFDTGGFQCVPGFVGETLKQWAKENVKLSEKYLEKHFVPVPKEDPLVKSAQVIGLPKGSLLIWSSELPHCNRYNSSSEFRYCQYIKMVPVDDIDDLEGRGNVVANAMTHAFVSTAPKDVTPVLGLQYRRESKNRRTFTNAGLLLALFFGAAFYFIKLQMTV